MTIVKKIEQGQKNPLIQREASKIKKIVMIGMLGLAAGCATTKKDIPLTNQRTGRIVEITGTQTNNQSFQKKQERMHPLLRRLFSNYFSITAHEFFDAKYVQKMDIETTRILGINKSRKELIKENKEILDELRSMGAPRGEMLHVLLNDKIFCSSLENELRKKFKLSETEIQKVILALQKTSDIEILNYIDESPEESGKASVRDGIKSFIKNLRKAK